MGSISSWEENADFWITVMRRGLDPFRTRLTDDAILAAAGDCSGRRILDAGCGEGYLSRKLAERGAEVWAIDRSRRLIKAAEDVNAVQRRNIRYFVEDFEQTTLLPEYFDVVVSNHSLNEVPDPGKALMEFARLLKVGGTLAILMLHPCFYMSRSKRNEASALVDTYFGVREVRQHLKVRAIPSPADNTVWLRPLEDYVEAMIGAGFGLKQVKEPHPPAELMARDKWWRDNFALPLFLLLSGIKLDRELTSERRDS